MADELIFYTSNGRKYVGMTQETIQNLLDEAGIACSFVSKEEYDAQMQSRLKVS